MKDKVAFVVQRYGLEVNGGAEYHCRLIAELLSSDYEVEVLTTKALDYMTWKDYYTEDIETINQITVRRFSCNSRNVDDFNKFSEFIFHDRSHTYFDEIEWMKKQGPYCPDLINFIEKEQGNFKAFIFFTYNYYTTYYGLQVAPEKSILIPTAHDEPPIYLSLYKILFHLPRAILFNTEEERKLVHRLFKNHKVPSDIVGVGVNLPDRFMGDQEFRQRFGIYDPFILYVGRVDESKGCRELFDFYQRYRNEATNCPKLVLIGKPVMNIPQDKDIISLGFVDETVKYGGISASEFMVVPSKYESLSMVTLESMVLRKPVLVNEHCEVLKGHCEKSNAGLYYSNYDEFKVCVDFLLNSHFNEKLGSNGASYVSSNYNWDTIKNKIFNHIDMV